MEEKLKDIEKLINNLDKNLSFIENYIYLMLK